MDPLKLIIITKSSFIEEWIFKLIEDNNLTGDLTLV